MSKRFFAIFAALVTALLVWASPAHAGNPHFIKNATTATLSGTSLIVTFKEAGLPSGQTETISASSVLTATYQCINNGGKNPSDPKKTTITQPVSESGEFTADKNGNVTGTLTLSVPSASSQLDCPNGQTATLTAFSFGNVTVSDSTSGASIVIRGPFAG